MGRSATGVPMDLGEIDLTDLALFEEGPPMDVFRLLRDEAPAFWHEPTHNTPGGEGFWCLTRYEDVAWAAKDGELFSSCTGGARDGGGTLIEDLPLGFGAGVLFNMQDDPRHHHIRRLVTPSVSPKRLRDIETRLRGRCDEILDDIVERGTCDFLVDVAAELPLRAIASLLGVPQEDRHRFMEWADATLDYEGRDPGEESTRSQEASAAMFAYGAELLGRKRQCPADDILSIIANADLPPQAEPGGPMTDLEQQMFFNLLITAGSETTRNALTAGVLAFMDHPDQWQALRDNRELMGTAVEEILRWASSTTYNRRTASSEIQRHGQTIRPGEKVVLWWPAANYDERMFRDPDTFDITRNPNPHLGFGSGSHFCLGAALARMEIRLVLDGLLDRVDRITPAGPAERTRSNKHTGFRHLPVVFR